MTHYSKVAAISTALASLAAPAFAHIGDHSTAPADHFLVEHGLALGAVALIAAVGTIAYIIKKKA